MALCGAKHGDFTGVNVSQQEFDRASKAIRSFMEHMTKNGEDPRVDLHMHYDPWSAGRDRNPRFRIIERTEPDINLVAGTMKIIKAMRSSPEHRAELDKLDGACDYRVKIRNHIRGSTTDSHVENLIQRTFDKRRSNMRRRYGWDFWRYYNCDYEVCNAHVHIALHGLGYKLVDDPEYWRLIMIAPDAQPAGMFPCSAKKHDCIPVEDQRGHAFRFVGQRSVGCAHCKKHPPNQEYQRVANKVNEIFGDSVPECIFFTGHESTIDNLTGEDGMRVHLVPKIEWRKYHTPLGGVEVRLDCPVSRKYVKPTAFELTRAGTVPKNSKNWNQDFTRKAPY